MFRSRFVHSGEMAPEKRTAALLLMASLIGLIGGQVSYDRATGTIGTGSIISPAFPGKSAWSSASGRFAFGFYKVGRNFAVGVQFFPNSTYSTVIWTANRDGHSIPANGNLTFGNEGLMLHLEVEGDQAIVDQYDSASQLAFASMLDSGNFVVYDVHGKIAWQTFDNPTDTLMAVQAFHFGQSLISSVSPNNHSSGKFRLAMQRDGNLVLYPVNTPETETNSYWALGSNGTYSLVLGQNGNFNLSQFLVPPHESSQGIGLLYFLRVDFDGYLRIYSGQSGSVMVSEQYPSGDNKCLIKGVCGLNSYCNSTSKGGFFCSCLPGYVSIDPSAGCQRKFTSGICEAASATSSTNGNFYSITKLPNITWSDDSYNSFQVKSEDDCGNECLNDCNCYAALFFGSTKRCSKQRQPFQYGRALFGEDEPTVAFVKVGHGEPKRGRLSVKPVGTGNLSVRGTRPLVLNLVLTATFAILFDFLIFFLCRYRIGMYRRLCESMETGLAKAMAPRFFSYRQLEEATDGYREKIGQGTYGKVFKGVLPLRDPGTPIAVKKLTSVPGRVEEKFRNELKSIGRVHHLNLVRLLGYCHEGSDWILVYEYMSGGSLADLIFRQHERPPSWKQRVAIAKDVARGLCHLHEGCDVAIIHGDIKPENVLIGNDGRAKIGDLGLAKHLQPGEQTTYTRPRGSFIYNAPDWANSYSCVSPKVDVVSFGVLLLELLCLKKFLQRVDGEYNLASWAYKCLTGQSELQVPGSDVDSKELEMMVKVALWCLVGSPEERPSMYDVLMMLSGKKVVEFPPVPLVDWSRQAGAGQPPVADAQRG